MAKEIPFGDLVREIRASQVVVSYNDLTPEPELGPDGRPVPWRPPKLRPTAGQAYRLLAPYVSVRFLDQARAVVPLAIYLVLFQILILRQSVEDSWIITGGMLAVVAGLMLFMEGLALGLMPFAEEIGDALPKKSRLPVVLAIVFALGVGVTFAEPAIGALQAAGALVDQAKAPLLHALLTRWTDILVLMVGAGVGVAAVLGTLRFLWGGSLKPFVYAAVGFALALTLYALTEPALTQVLGLAWDCGAVTTGPVTVPIVLALGIGIAAAGGRGGGSLSGFGIVTLASLFPVIAVLCLGIYVFLSGDHHAVAGHGGGGTPWWEATPWTEIIGGLRAIVPLVLFLFFIHRVVLGETIPNRGVVFYGLVLALLGMIVFNLGLSYGLAKLGGQSGSLVPAAFHAIEAVKDSPLYFPALGVLIALTFAWILGFGATLAEPALNALGMTVENLTQGAFRKQTLMYAVSVGVAFGIALGVARIVYEWPLAWLVVPGYLIALALTALSSEEFVNVAWDSAGVTTGPVTVPLVLAMGLGFGNAVEALDGFGILSMASIGPIVSVLATGLWIRLRGRVKYEDIADVDEEAGEEA